MSRSTETHMELAIHRCWKMRVSRFYPDINNAIALEFCTEESGIEVIVYGLDEQACSKLLEDFGDDNTTISRHARRGDVEAVALKEIEDDFAA